MLSDLRLTLRALAKSPGFAFVAIFTLALGLGVNTAIFSIVNAVVLRGLPFPESNRLLLVRMANPADGNHNRMAVSQQDFADFRAQQKSFEDLAAYRDRTCTISGPGGDPERVSGVEFSAAGPGMLRLPTHLGRWFTADEDKPGAPATVVLGYTLWENRFKSNPAIVGQQLKVNGEWATVIGIGPKGNRFPEESDLWIPWRFSKIDEKRDERYLGVFGRLRPGVTPEQAQAEFAGLAQRLATEHPDTNKNIIAQVRPFKEGFIDDGTRQLMGIMFGAVFFVLLIACTNVANLLLSRAAIRQKEMAIRSALGAGRARLVRLLLTESFVLSTSGAALGLGLAYALMAVFNAYIQQKAPYWMIFSIDGAVIGYAAVLVAITCVLAGLFPAWRISRPDVNAALKDGGRGSTNFALSRFTRLMVIGEVVLSCVLLIVSGLYVRSVIKMQTVGLGFETAGIFTSRVALPEKDYADPVKQRFFYKELLERVAARPEIGAVAIADQQPTWDNRSSIVLEGKSFGEQTGRGGPRASFTAVSPDYFRTLGVPFLQGREFTERDTAEAEPVALVSSAFVEKYWPGENPLGKRFRQGSGRPGEEIKWLTVVGVVGATLQGQFEGDVPPQAYIPHTQQKEMFRMTLFVKARGGDPAALAPVIRREVQALNADLPIYFAQTLDHMIADAKFFKRMFAWIFGIFGVVALVLAGGGLYGVMAYSVSQRTQEIGVRVALGASPRAVLGLILREGGLRLAIGLVLGLALGYGAARLQGEFLYGVQAADAPTFIGTLLTLGFAGLLACLVPALRALRVNPVEALRS
ncbi:MAG: macrolide transporter ATP-binding/permease protein [Lacunisphaera sp.]|nr:macrolide transporter ATP-binding/permease protein [Lacunisphaera sp.]